MANRAQPRFCPRCGATTVAAQRFCARCGLDMTSLHTQEQFGSASSTHTSSSSTSRYQSTTPLQQPARKRTIGRVGCVLVLMLLLAALGTAAYVSGHILGIHVPGFGTGSQPTITTTALNTTVVYAGASATLVDVQQAQSFLDDTNTTTSSVIRLHLRTQNSTTLPVYMPYASIVHLLLPSGKTLTPDYVNGSANVPAGVSVASTLDFAVPDTQHVDQLSVRLGAANEAQLNIPLVAHVDLGVYAPKTTPINGQLQYLGLRWTIVNATTQLSIAGQQAPSGMRYVILQVAIDNTLSQVAIAGSPFDYMRLKTANTMQTPVDTTLPVSFDAGTNGKTGTVTFLVPQNVSALTFVLLSQKQSGFAQATTDFQLP